MATATRKSRRFVKNQSKIRAYYCPAISAAPMMGRCSQEHIYVLVEIGGISSGLCKYS